MTSSIPIALLFRSEKGRDGKTRSGKRGGTKGVSYHPRGYASFTATQTTKAVTVPLTGSTGWTTHGTVSCQSSQLGKQTNKRRKREKKDQTKETHTAKTKAKLFVSSFVSLLVTWCFEPSQQHRANKSKTKPAKRNQNKTKKAKKEQRYRMCELMIK